MKIIEHFLKGKKDDQNLCEDGYIIKNNLVAVVDGVTSKGNHLWENSRTSGRYAMELVIDYLKGDVEQKDSISLFNEISTIFKNNYNKVFDSTIVEEKLRACIIVYNNLYKEIWSYGDCQCMINNAHYQDEKEIDVIIAKKRADVIKGALKNGATTKSLMENDCGRVAILKDLNEMFEYENKVCKFGYPVINGDSVIPDFIKKHKVNLGDTVVLASDGYPKLCDSLAESELELGRLLKSDPICIYENMSTKGLTPNYNSFDDRCYCKFIIN